MPWLAGPHTPSPRQILQSLLPRTAIPLLRRVNPNTSNHQKVLEDGNVNQRRALRLPPPRLQRAARVRVVNPIRRVDVRQPYPIHLGSRDTPDATVRTRHVVLKRLAGLVGRTP